MAEQIKKIAVTTVGVDSFIYVWCDAGYIPAIEEICGVVLVEPDIARPGRFTVWLDPRYNRDEVVKEIEGL